MTDGLVGRIEPGKVTERKGNGGATALTTQKLCKNVETLRDLGHLVETEITSRNYLTALVMLDYLSDTLFSAVPYTNRFALDPFYLAVASGLEMEYSKRVEGNPVARRGMDELVQYARRRGGVYGASDGRSDEPYQIPSGSPGPAVGPSGERSPQEGLA